MKTIRLTHQQARILLMNLEGNPTGYSRGQLRLLDRKIAPKLEEPIAEYRQAMDAVITATNRELEELDPNVRGFEARVQSCNIRHQKAIEKLIASEGEALVVIDLEDAEHEFVKTHGLPQQGLLGDARSRKVSLEIEDAVNKAEEVGALVGEHE